MRGTSRRRNEAELPHLPIPVQWIGSARTTLLVPMIKFDPMKHRIPILKRLIPSVKKRIAKLTWWDGYAIRRSNGALFLLNYHNQVDRQVAFYGDYEADRRRYLFLHIAQHGCDLFLDVGANFGIYSILAARGGLADRIVAFEPDQRNRVQMEANLLMNGLLSKVEIVAKAVSKETGFANFLPSPDTSTGQSKVGEGVGAIQVETVTLDDFLDLSGRRVFIKMDIEGHELEAVQGMKRLVTSNRVFMQVECFPANAPLFDKAMTTLGLKRCHQIGHDHYYSNF